MQEKDMYKEQLIDVNRRIKFGEQERRSILWAMSDPEKAKKLYDIVNKLHGSILDSDERILDKVVEDTFQDSPEIVEWYKKNKNSRFFKSSDIFDGYQEHPVQRDMVRKKSVGKRTIKKAKTANNHVTIMHEAKHNYLLKLENIEQQDRLDQLEKSMDLKLKVMEQSISDIVTELIGIKSQVEELSEDIKYVYEHIGDKRKVQAYHVRKQHPEYTVKDIASAFGVDRRTIHRWVTEVENLLSQTVT